MTVDDNDPAVRIADLEREVKFRDDKIKELRAEVTEAHQLVIDMREQVEDADRLLDNWIDTFEMQRGDDGNWLFDPSQSELWEKHLELWKSHQELRQKWNKFVPEYNAAIKTREMGRPVAASTAQQDDVHRRRKAGQSLRAIATVTGLGLKTVRTIIANKPRKPTNELRRRELDRLRAARYRARKKARDQLPAQITEAKTTGEALIKAAKGLGR